MNEEAQPEQLDEAIDAALTAFLGNRDLFQYGSAEGIEAYRRWMRRAINAYSETIHNDQANP